jgi:hypothetical protein
LTYTVDVGDLGKIITLEITSSAETGTISCATISAVTKKTVSAPAAPTLESKTHNSVTLTAIEGYEYSIDGEEWQPSSIFDGLKSGTEYAFCQRVAETDDTSSSEKSPVLNIRTGRAVTVIGGTALHSHGSAGTEVTLTPGEAPKGTEFKEWNVIEGNVTITDNTFIIGDSDVKVEAVWEKVYSVTVTGGAASVQSGKEGKEVTLTPGEAPEGKTFKKWNTLSGKVSIKDNTFIIGTENVEIEAAWEDIPDRMLVITALMVFVALIAVVSMAYFIRQGRK